MAGLGRGVVGFFFLLVGLAFSSTISALAFGLLFLVAGVILLGSAFYGAEDAELTLRREASTRRRLREEMQLNATELNRQIGLDRRIPSIDDVLSPGPRLKTTGFQSRAGVAGSAS